MRLLSYGIRLLSIYAWWLSIRVWVLSICVDYHIVHRMDKGKRRGTMIMSFAFWVYCSKIVAYCMPSMVMPSTPLAILSIIP